MSGLKVVEQVTSEADRAALPESISGQKPPTQTGTGSRDSRLNSSLHRRRPGPVYQTRVENDRSL